MPMNAQKRVALFECDNGHILFRGIEEFTGYACDEIVIQYVLGRNRWGERRIN